LLLESVWLLRQGKMEEGQSCGEDFTVISSSLKVARRAVPILVWERAVLYTVIASCRRRGLTRTVIFARQ